MVSALVARGRCSGLATNFFLASAFRSGHLVTGEDSGVATGVRRFLFTSSVSPKKPVISITQINHDIDIMSLSYTQ